MQFLQVENVMVVPTQVERESVYAIFSLKKPSDNNEVAVLNIILLDVDLAFDCQGIANLDNLENTSGDMRMLSDLQLVYRLHAMVPRNSTQLPNINTTKFQVERQPVYYIPTLTDNLTSEFNHLHSMSVIL